MREDAVVPQPPDVEKLPPESLTASLADRPDIKEQRQDCVLFFGSSSGESA
jgi:hypothetical protein